MRRAKVVEIFRSLQGEGFRVGRPSIFLRLFGCNLKCSNFGTTQKVNGINQYEKLDLSNIQKLEDVPILSVGCDSTASWMPRFSYLFKSMTIPEIVRRIYDQFPIDCKYTNFDLIITGGEPLLLGNQKTIIELLQTEDFPEFGGITFETNGTTRLRADLAFALFRLTTKSILFSVSPKLSNSGEDPSNTIIPIAVKSYSSFAPFKVVLKFVVRSYEQRFEIKDVVQQYKDYGCRIEQIYLMPEGVDVETIQKVSKDIIELCYADGYVYSPRLQVDLFGNAWNT